jgi:DUF2971 family protein
MALPPIYKYLDVDGAKKTLGNKCFRFAKPSEYEDLEDMTAQSLFPDELEAALAVLSEGFVNVIVEYPDAAPTCSEKLKPKVAELQQIFLANRSAAQAVKDGLKRDPAGNGFNVDYWRARSEAFVADTNELLQGHRVLCATTDNASDRMWKEYAEDHQGVVLRIDPNVAKDSKFQKFAPVTYQEKRPSIYSRTIDFARESLFGDQTAKARSIMDRIIYAKTNDHRFESEYRLAIPLGEGEEDYRTLPYHPEEVTELYLGASMKPKDKTEIVAKAKALNPKIKVYQAERDGHGQISFEAG